MNLDNVGVFNLLEEKGVSHFYHANTVATSMSFLAAGGLLSRGDVERVGLVQTRQASDEDDMKFDVWDDVFIDIVDMHGFFPRQNYYGPVLFKFSKDFLLAEGGDLWVTKNNPVYWKAELEHQDKYFMDVEELDRTWDAYPLQQKMFTVRKPGRPILFDYLEEIVVDDPDLVINNEILLVEEAMNSITVALQACSNIEAQVRIRECSCCYCRDNYNASTSADLRRLFLPPAHPAFNIG